MHASVSPNASEKHDLIYILMGIFLIIKGYQYSCGIAWYIKATYRC